MLVYTLGTNGLPEPASKQTYFTGTDPVSLTITTPANDLNGDSIPDLVVANQGSNDVSVFLGAIDNLGVWYLDSRPRQSSGGIGPTSVAVASVPNVGGIGDAPDLLVSNGQSNNVAVLASRGNGFFINQPGMSFSTGIDPQELFVGNFDRHAGLDLLTVNTGSNDLTQITDFLTHPVVTSISSGGTLPESSIIG